MGVFAQPTFTTTDGIWQIVGSRPVVHPFKARLDIDAKRADGTNDFFFAETLVTGWLDGGSAVVDTEEVSAVGNTLVAYRLTGVGAEVQFEVRGRPLETWDWVVTLKDVQLYEGEE